MQVIKTITIRVKPELHAELKEVAWRSRISQSEFVRQTIQNAITQYYLKPMKGN